MFSLRAGLSASFPGHLRSYRRSLCHVPTAGPHALTAQTLHQLSESQLTGEPVGRAARNTLIGWTALLLVCSTHMTISHARPRVGMRDSIFVLEVWQDLTVNHIKSHLLSDSTSSPHHNTVVKMPVPILSHDGFMEVVYSFINFVYICDFPNNVSKTGLPTPQSHQCIDVF